MKYHKLLTFLALIVFAAGVTGCDAFEDVFENEKEVSGVVEEIGDNFLTVEATRYTVTADTEYDGITGLADLSVGDEVEIEYEENGGNRVALEIETGSDDD